MAANTTGKIKELNVAKDKLRVGVQTFLDLEAQEKGTNGHSSDKNGKCVSSNGLAEVVVRLAIRKAAGFVETTLVASKGVPQLGFAPTGTPPGCVVVGRLETGGWASERGVKRHDEILSINGKQISAFKDKQELTSALKARPLRIRVLHAPAGAEHEPTMQVMAKDIDETARAVAADRAAGNATKRVIGKVNTAKEALQGVVQEAAKASTVLVPELEEYGIDAAALEALGELAETMEERQEEEKKECLHQLLDMRLELAFTIIADEEVVQFGFTCNMSTWQVRTIEDDGWGKDQGVQVGDLLLMLDESLTEHMTNQALIKFMRNRRPLQLTFLRTAPPVDVSPPLSSVYSAAALMLKILPKSDEEDEDVFDPDKDQAAGVFSFLGNLGWFGDDTLSKVEETANAAMTKAELTAGTTAKQFRAVVGLKKAAKRISKKVEIGTSV